MELHLRKKAQEAKVLERPVYVTELLINSRACGMKLCLDKIIIFCGRWALFSARAQMTIAHRPPVRSATSYLNSAPEVSLVGPFEVQGIRRVGRSVQILSTRERRANDNAGEVHTGNRGRGVCSILKREKTWGFLHLCHRPSIYSFRLPLRSARPETGRLYLEKGSIERGITILLGAR